MENLDHYSQCIVANTQQLLETSLNTIQAEQVRIIYDSTVKLLDCYYEMREQAEASTEQHAIMCHDLSNKLTPIRGYAQLLNRGVIGVLTTAQKKYIGNIIQYAESLRSEISGNSNELVV